MARTERTRLPELGARLVAGGSLVSAVAALTTALYSIYHLLHVFPTTGPLALPLGMALPVVVAVVGVVALIAGLMLAEHFDGLEEEAAARAEEAEPPLAA